MCVLGVGIFRIRSQLARTVSLAGDEHWDQLIVECSSRIGMRRRPDVVVTLERTMPCAVGIFRPKIVLPLSALGWDSERRRMVILHELGHVKRGDLWLQWLSLAVRCVYWFNPVVMLLHRALMEHREEACDALVVASGACAKEYARHLLEIASSHRDASALSPALAMAGKISFQRKTRKAHCPVARQKAQWSKAGLVRKGGGAGFLCSRVGNGFRRSSNDSGAGTGSGGLDAAGGAAPLDSRSVSWALKYVLLCREDSLISAF